MKDEPVVMPALLAGLSHLTGTTQDTYIFTINRVRPGEPIRRLSPLECERLMGWPDGWTDGHRDSHRFHLCGNGVVSNVAQWFGERYVQAKKETADAGVL
jgi:site-specific DNA-cytosine methylase